MNKIVENAIKDRLINGFSNWNNGYESWLEWCDTLYEPTTHYNIYGNRFTLKEYKDMMGLFFQKYEIELGEFDNILFQGNWIAIRYTVYIMEKSTGQCTEQKTMEFVEFKDNSQPIGPRVVEGWALSDKPLTET